MTVGTVEGLAAEGGVDAEPDAQAVAPSGLLGLSGLGDRARMTGEEVPLSRNRRFQALWIGGAGAYLGSGFATVAVPLLILAVTGSARSLATRAVVAPGQLTKALATEGVRTHTASIVGPSLAGVLYAVSRTLPFLGAAFGYLVGAVPAVLAFSTVIGLAALGAVSSRAVRAARAARWPAPVVISGV